MTLRGAPALALVLALALGACTGTASEQGSAPSPTSAATAPVTTPSPSPAAAAELPPLAQAPSGDVSLWLNTIGIPVVAAVRTSTPLAELAEVAPSQRAATCRGVAGDLDGIAAPQVLAGLAITADAETATLLVGDLQAKGDLLAACEAGAEELEERIAEVERTHAVAVAWLTRLREAG